MNKKIIILGVIIAIITIVIFVICKISIKESNKNKESSNNSNEIKYYSIDEILYMLGERNNYICIMWWA